MFVDILCPFPYTICAKMITFNLDETLIYYVHNLFSKMSNLSTPAKRSVFTNQIIRLDFHFVSPHYPVSTLLRYFSSWIPPTKAVIGCLFFQPWKQLPITTKADLFETLKKSEMWTVIQWCGTRLLYNAVLWHPHTWAHRSSCFVKPCLNEVETTVIWHEWGNFWGVNTNEKLFIKQWIFVKLLSDSLDASQIHSLFCNTEITELITQF